MNHRLNFIPYSRINTKWITDKYKNISLLEKNRRKFSEPRVIWSVLRLDAIKGKIGSHGNEKTLLCGRCL